MKSQLHPASGRRLNLVRLPRLLPGRAGADNGVAVTAAVAVVAEEALDLDLEAPTPMFLLLHLSNCAH